MRRSAVVLAALVALVPALPAFPALAAGAPPAIVTYRPPVDAPVVDAFRPPPENWNAGNRGLDYATRPGTPVGASADGEVVFAGPIAGEHHVVVLHDDGIRTSYSFLASVAVRRGDKVRQGEPVGTAGERVHFGARAGEAYVDPALLFGGGPPQVHLVPDEERHPKGEAEERSGLLRTFAGFGGRVVSGAAAGVEWARDGGVEVVTQGVTEALDETRGALRYALENPPGAHVARFASAADAWWKARQTCTPDSVPAPKLPERHVLVRVAGLGSTSEGGAIDDVDAAALGYADGDVFRYSYRGGTSKENAYAATDTTSDLRQSGRRLRDLLARIEADHPGVPIDIVAHSQGGLVARSALTDEADPADGRLPKVSSLVTLGTPHLGAPGATALRGVGRTTAGKLLLTGAHDLLPDTIDPAATSIAQMAERSEFLRRLNDRPLPEGLRATSIAAREDLTVPAGRTLVAGAHNVTVSAPGLLDDHGNLPGSSQAHREIALGLAGMAPTCQTFGDAMADAAVSGLIYATESGLRAGAHMGLRQVDAGVGIPPRYDE